MEDLNIHLEKINPVTVNHLSLPTITLWLKKSPLEYGQTSNIKKTTSSKASPKSSTRFFPESLKAWLKLRCSVLEQILSQADFDDFGSVGSWPIGLNMLTSMACVEKPRSPGFNSSKQRTSKWEFNWCLVWTDRLTDAGIYEPRLVRSPHPPKRKGVSGLFLEDSVCESKFFRFWHCFLRCLLMIFGFFGWEGANVLFWLPGHSLLWHEAEHTSFLPCSPQSGLSHHFKLFRISWICHIHCLQVLCHSFCSFCHLQIKLKTGQQGCHSHGRAIPAMYEAMDAALLPGLRSKLLKLHRNLSDDFKVFFRFVDLLKFTS